MTLATTIFNILQNSGDDMPQSEILEAITAAGFEFRPVSEIPDSHIWADSLTPEAMLMDELNAEPSEAMINYYLIKFVQPCSWAAQWIYTGTCDKLHLTLTDKAFSTENRYSMKRVQEYLSAANLFRMATHKRGGTLQTIFKDSTISLVTVRQMIA